MSEGMKFFDGLVNEINNGMHNCLMARIETYDPVTMQADVTPLYKQKYKDGKEEQMPMIIALPVAHLKAGPFIIRPPYKRGDIVMVAFSDYSTEEVLISGGSHAPRSSRKHSIDDGIVVAGIMVYTDTYPAQHGNDLLISKDDLSAKIVIQEDNTILIHTDKDVSVKATGNITVEAGNNVSVTAGNNASVQANNNIDMNAGANVTVTANNKATITGMSGVDIQSDGPVNVNGSTINLN